MIVYEHNRLRQRVALGQIPNQPQAANLEVLRWDNELARVAQNWANNCHYYHNPYRHIGRFLVGENIARIWSTSVPVSSWQYIMNRWFSEYQIYIFNYSAFTAATGHYTQMAWATTSLIGCGYSLYLTPEGTYTKYYVCNYGPSGNYQGQAPYRVGQPVCSNYGLRYSLQYYGLCER